MTHGLYLYGILPADSLDSPDSSARAKTLTQTLEPLKGLDQQPIQTQTIDRFTVLYSEAQQTRYLSSRRNLLGHERVLETAMEAGYRNLLPLRFGLTVADWPTVESQLITPYGEQMESLLSKLEGAREVSIKIFWNPDEELQQLLVENDALRAERDRMAGQALSMEQVIAIGQSIEQAMTDRQHQIIQTFQSQLSSLAIDQVENPTLTAEMIYNAAYLIPWEQESRFAERVEQLDANYPDRLTIRYNNFTAPYNFAQLN